MIEKEFGTCKWHKNCIAGTDTRIMGNCVRCGKEVSFSHGHLAPPLNKNDLRCGRCVSR